MAMVQSRIGAMSQSRTRRDPAHLLEHEFAQEKAAALGRLGRALEAALAALQRFDAEPQDKPGPAERRELRASLAAEASIALWQFIVQREACGLRDMRAVLRDYRVPAEVAAQMGVLSGPLKRSRKHERGR
jgi:Family of unknown function (DUF6665)